MLQIKPVQNQKSCTPNMTCDYKLPSEMLFRVRTKLTNKNRQAGILHAKLHEKNTAGMHYSLPDSQLL